MSDPPPDPSQPDADPVVDADRTSSQPRYDWLGNSKNCRDVDRTRRTLESIAEWVTADDLLDSLAEKLRDQSHILVPMDQVIDDLVRYIRSSRSPTALLALFQRDPEALHCLLRLLATSPVVAKCLIDDAEAFELIRMSDGRSSPREFLIDELSAELSGISNIEIAKPIVRRFVTRESMRVAFGEFVRDATPGQSAREITRIADAMIQCCLDHIIEQLSPSRLPNRIDGSKPRFAVIGLGDLGGEELTYGDTLPLILICDQIDRRNRSHVSYYRDVAKGLLTMLAGDTLLGFAVDTDHQLRKFDDDPIVGLSEAAEICESSPDVWRRIDFVKARVVAGDRSLGSQFLGGIQSWIYRRFLTRSDLTELRAVRQRVERRLEQNGSDEKRDQDDRPLDSSAVVLDIRNCPGGLRDVKRVVTFLQLLHGGQVDDVQVAGTNRAIDALEKAGCVTHQEAGLLSSGYAKLTRLEHQWSIMSGRRDGRIPNEPDTLQRLAWQLGIRDQDGRQGDVDKFLRTLEKTLKVHQRIIHHLMDEPDRGHPSEFTLSDAFNDDGQTSFETELILDPDPDPDLIRQALSRYAFSEPKRIMDDLLCLASESTPFLSARRCRHFFAALVPELLAEISATPDPSMTLDRLVRMADSIGGKATLWELLHTHQATLRLIVRMCAAAPYLVNVLTGNPGMIDELIDSLVIDHLPSSDRLDAQSIRLCQGAVDPGPILQSFKDAAHLTIGVRQLLGKEPVPRTRQALADTADAVLRRVMDFEQSNLAQRFGDPASDEATGLPAELIALAFGKLGGREPNYHSDLDVLFLYTHEGETQRRVGGPRTTTGHQHFFSQIAKRVIDRVNRDVGHGRLYELDSRLRPTDEEGILSVTIDHFLRRFTQDVAPLWQRLAFCKARPLSGTPSTRRAVAMRVSEVLRATRWRDSMMDEAKKLRHRMQQAASPDNLKRGRGGTVDVELLTQLWTLRHAADTQHPTLIGPERATGTQDVLAALAEADHLPPDVAVRLAENYTLLRSIEADLRLLACPERHELPRDDALLAQLSFLRGMTVDQIRQSADDARAENRELFDRLTNQSSG